MRRIGLPLLSLSLLVGCAPALAPIPAASTVAPPMAWRTSLEGRAEIEPQWWNAFGDPALAWIVAAARANNPDIAIASARVREARGQERASRSLLVPTLDGSTGVSEVGLFRMDGQTWVLPTSCKRAPYFRHTNWSGENSPLP